VIILNDTTTIQVPSKLKKDLDSFKDYARETYAEVIEKLIASVKEDEEAEMELSTETLKGIEEAKGDIRKGRVYTTSQMKKELGL